MAKTKTNKLTLKHIIGYGAGDCGGCFGLYMVSMYMARFLQVNLGVNAGVLATILLIWNIWDTVNDPLMGTIMDMCFAKAKPGADKFRPWILASIPIMFVGIISFYVVPPVMGGGFMTIAAAFILKIVFEAGYTIANSLSVILIAAVGFDAAVSLAGGDQAPSTVTAIKLMVCGFPAVAALGSFCCFTFIWCINADVRAKMADKYHGGCLSAELQSPANSAGSENPHGSGNPVQRGPGLLSTIIGYVHPLKCAKNPACSFKGTNRPNCFIAAMSDATHTAPSRCGSGCPARSGSSAPAGPDGG